MNDNRTPTPPVPFGRALGAEGLRDAVTRLAQSYGVGLFVFIGVESDGTPFTIRPEDEPAETLLLLEMSKRTLLDGLS